MFSQIYTMIEVIFKIFLTDYIDFQGFITKRIQKPLLIEYKWFPAKETRSDGFCLISARKKSIKSLCLT
jgi:hypothetical protein